MLTEERKARIISLLELHTVVKTQDLISLCNASESTIRRDLQELEDEGKLERIHGGAKRPVQLDEELAFSEKTVKNVHEKSLIAQTAAATVRDKEVIYLDAGSTTLEMIPYLINKQITVVTNSANHAAALADHQIPTIILGGFIKLKTNAIVGSQALEQLRQYRFSKVFLGMNGIHPLYGYTTPDPEEAAIKRLALQQGDKAYILADHSKFEQVSFTKVGDLKKAVIITDRCAPQLAAKFAGFTTIKEAKS